LAADGAAVALLMSPLQPVRRALRHPVPAPGYLPTSVRRPRVPGRAQNQGRPDRIRVGQLAEVLGLELTELVAGRSLDVLQPPGVAADGLFQEVACEPAVAERVAPSRSCKNPTEGHLRLAADVVVCGAGQLAEDLDQLVVRVVVELDGRPEPAGEPGVLREEGHHRLGVAGHDDDELVPVVLHLFDQGVDRLGAVVVAAQRVGLVDEQHPAHGLAAHLSGLHRRLTQVPGDELGAIHLDEVALVQQPEGVVDARDHPGDGRLAGAGVAHEDEVPGHIGVLHPGGLTLLLDLEHGDLLMDLALDALQADHRVELGEQLLDGLLRLGRLFRLSCFRAAARTRRRVKGVDASRNLRQVG
jgi:hypothetical protein